jgi:hypothetical protein
VRRGGSGEPPAGGPAPRREQLEGLNTAGIGHRPGAKPPNRRHRHGLGDELPADAGNPARADQLSHEARVDAGRTRNLVGGEDVQGGAGLGHVSDSGAEGAKHLPAVRGARTAAA